MGVRRFDVAGAVTITTALMLLTSVSVDGTFFGDLFWGLLVFGSGMGAAFVCCQIAALDGVAEKESGVAAGLVDTSFNIGSALGIATTTSVAVSVSCRRAGRWRAGRPVVALTEGFQSSFGVAAVVAGFGLLAALYPPRSSPQSRGRGHETGARVGGLTRALRWLCWD